jgi:hypothetical protein
MFDAAGSKTGNRFTENSPVYIRLLHPFDRDLTR